MSRRSSRSVALAALAVCDFCASSSARHSRRRRSTGHRCADPVSSPSLAIDAGCGARDDSGRLLGPTIEQWLHIPNVQEYVAGFAFKSEGTGPFIRVPAHEMSETDVPLVTIPATTRIARRANGTHWRMPRTHAESQTSGNYSHGTTDSVSSSSRA
jgi:hypothetical protein